MVRSILILAVAGHLLSCKPRTDAELSGLIGDLPENGRSTFDFAIAEAPGSKVPFPFERLIAHLEKFGPSIGVLGPVGRSLQSEAGMPNPFKDPRRLVAFGGDSESKLDIGSKVFLGYVKASNQVEVISYNEYTGNYEFQLVSNYSDGETPIVQYANRQVCLSCHQHGGPIFTPVPWTEFNGNNLIGSLILRHHPGGELDGIPILQRATRAPGGSTSYAFESNVSRAARVIRNNRAWKKMCPSDPVGCRGVVFKKSILAFFDHRISNQEEVSKLDAELKKHSTASEIIPNMDVFSSAGLSSRDFRARRTNRAAIDRFFGSQRRNFVDFSQAFQLPASLPTPNSEQAFSEERLMKEGRFALERLVNRMADNAFPTAANDPRLSSRFRQNVRRDGRNFFGDSRGRNFRGGSSVTSGIELAEQFIALSALRLAKGPLDPKTPRDHDRSAGFVNLSEALRSGYQSDVRKLVTQKVLIEKNIGRERFGSLEVTLKVNKSDSTFSRPRATLRLSTTGGPAFDPNSLFEFREDAPGNCERSESNELHCRFNAQKASNLDEPNAGGRERAIFGTIELHLPTEIGSTSNKSSAFVVASGRQSGTHYVLCTAENSGESFIDNNTNFISYTCSPFDIRKIVSAVEAVIADNRSNSDGALNLPIMRPGKLMNEFLQRMDLETLPVTDWESRELPKVAIPKREENFVEIGGALGTLYRFCGECHASIEPHMKNEIPQFLTGQNKAALCASVQGSLTSIVDALESGFAEDSYMPPPNYELNSSFTNGVRSSLIEALRSKKFCNK